jgi:hypothetical protein
MQTGILVLAILECARCLTVVPLLPSEFYIADSALKQQS